MKLSRRKLMAAAPALMASSALPAFAQSFPSKTVTLVVPYAPGGNIDVLARALSIPLSKELGQNVVVDNRGGGGGAIGTALVARAEADGYSLLLTTPGQFATLPHMLPVQYKSTDFEPICVASRTPMLLVVRKNESRFSTLAEFIKFAKASGKPITAGHAGPGTPNHLSLLQFENATGVPISAIAYRGSGPAVVDLLGGQIDVVFDQTTSSMAHIKGGALQALAVLSAEPLAALPGVPSLSQAGLTAFDGTTYVGVLVPARTPSAAIAVLASALRKSIEDPVVVGRLRELGSEAYFAGGNAYRTAINNEEKLAVELVRTGRLKAE